MMSHELPMSERLFKRRGSRSAPLVFAMHKFKTFRSFGVIVLLRTTFIAISSRAISIYLQSEPLCFSLFNPLRQLLRASPFSAP